MNKDFKLKDVTKRKIVTPNEKKNVKAKVINFENIIKDVKLKDGMVISFHHHLRNGDYVFNMVMEKIEKANVKNLTLFMSAIFPTHAKLVEYMKDGIITNIYTGYISGPVGKAIVEGGLEGNLIMHTHGGRPRIVQDNEVTIDVAFIASPTVDKDGTISSLEGRSSFGAMGYALVDADYAKTVVAITDNFVDKVKLPTVRKGIVDFICVVDAIGDPAKIVGGTTQITKNPIGLKIASLATRAILASPYYKDGISFQTGAGGTSLAVAKNLRDAMIKDDIKGSFAAGGITGYLVDMFNDGLFKELWDCQCFDMPAIESIKKNKNHHMMSASKYASVYDDAMVDKLDTVILGATEIDTDFNVNVLTGSDGVIMGGSGGHSDTAYGAKMTIIVTQLMNARISAIVDKVTTVTTPGQTVDVVVTERGIAVNPLRKDLIKAFTDAKLPLKTISELRDISQKMTGKPKKLERSKEIVGIVQYRDGQTIDYIYKIR